MEFRLYPTYPLVEHRGSPIPNIHLPENFKELVKRFYKQGRRKSIEEYQKKLEEILKKTNFETQIMLQWDDKVGLINISTRGAGLYLNEEGIPNYQEHNLGIKNSFVLGAIAQMYISELLKSQ